MPSLFAIPHLIEGIKDQFAEDGNTAAVLFGFKEPAKQINQGLGQANRVVFVPGVDMKGGDYGPPRYPYGNSRPLVQWDEQFTVSVWARDPNDQTELAQYEACRRLHDETVRAIYLKAHGTFEISDPEWIKPEIEVTFGYALRFTLMVQAPILDEPFPVVGVGVDDSQVAPGVPGEIQVGVKLNDETDATDIIEGETP